MTKTSDRNVGAPRETAVQWAGTETMEVRKTAPIEVAASDRDLAKSPPIPAMTREVSMAESKDRPALRPDDPRHGTNVGYNLNCRLECCRHAHMVWMKKYRMYGGVATVDSLGFERRVRALQAIGYTGRSISAALGRSKSFVDATLGQERVRQSTFDLMAEAYERLCMTPPQGWVADRARRRAKEAGHPPPLAWEDIDNDPEPTFDADPGDNLIDEVKVQRVLDGIKQDCTLAERLQVIDQWTGSLHQLERITGWNVHRLIGKKAA